LRQPNGTRAVDGDRIHITVAFDDDGGYWLCVSGTSGTDSENARERSEEKSAIGTRADAP
jgi:hypothetical protein